MQHLPLKIQKATKAIQLQAQAGITNFKNKSTIFINELRTKLHYKNSDIIGEVLGILHNITQTVKCMKNTIKLLRRFKNPICSHKHVSENNIA
jgi:hypothetical protein